MAAPTVGENRRRLLNLLRKRSLRRGDVVLSSGEVSDYYIDGKMVEVHPEGAWLIGEVLYDQTSDLDFDAIGGLAVGAVPMITSFVVSCYHHRRDVEGFFVRAERKAHGTQRLIEGDLKIGARVVLVDDVITSGQSVMKAIEAVREREGQVVLVLAIVDRDRGAAELFNRESYPYRSVFTKEDLFET